MTLSAEEDRPNVKGPDLPGGSGHGGVDASDHCAGPLGGHAREAEGPPLLRNAGRRGSLRSALILLVGDTLLLQVVVILAILLRAALVPWLPIEIHPETFLGIHLAVLFLPVVFLVTGAYPGYGRTPVERLRDRVTITALCFGGMLLFDHVAQGGQWSRGILLIAGVIAVFAVPGWDAVARGLLIRAGAWGVPIAVLGPEDRRAALVASLRRTPDLGWIPAVEAELPTLGTRGAPAVDLALITAPEGTLKRFSWDSGLPYRRVVLVTDLEEAQSLWASVRDVGGRLGLEIQQNLLVPANRLVKRVLDLALTTSILPFAFLVCLPFALALVALSPGPVFFTQVRHGLDGRPFRMIKLRTMHPDAEARLEELLAASTSLREEWQAGMKLRHDPRLVPGVGHLMRRFSIDELPQLLNVMAGHMSLVGPRPLPDYHLAALAPATRQVRSKVRPGITGLWQVSGRSACTLADQQRLDTYYVRNWSLWLDIHILARTAFEVLKGRGSW